MRTALGAALLALLVAAGLGFSAQSRPAAARASDQSKPVSASWYVALPRDPTLATAAYLARVPTPMRERGEMVSQSRYCALAARIVGSLGAILLFLYSGAASALEATLTRTTRYRWLQTFAYALALLVYVFMVTLPVEVWASYIRYRAFAFSEQPFLDWLKDYSVEWASTALFYGAGLAILMAVIRRRPRTWFLWAGLVYLALDFVYTAATPVIIAPLTNSYTPLPSNIGCITFPIAVFGQSETMPGELPLPSGSLGIGRVGYDWTDVSRPNRNSADPKARRELMGYIWYPTGQNPAQTKGAYLPGAHEMNKVPELQN